MPIDSARKNRFTFSALIRNLLFIVIILQFLPPMIISLQKEINRYLHPKTYVGVLRINGIIANSHRYIKQLHKFQKDSDIKAVLLKIDSPGGLPGASQSLFMEIQRFSKEKPVVALVEDLAASGGYYIASAADKILSTPSALIGSVGVILALPNAKELAHTAKLKFDHIKSGEYKDITSWYHDRTPQDIAYLQNISNSVYDQFINDVAAARKLDIATKDTWANGKIFSGAQGMKLKLVDKLGTVTDAKELITELLKKRNVEMPGKIKFVYPARPSKLQLLLHGDPDEDTLDEISTSLARMISRTSQKVALENNHQRLNV